MRGAALVLLVFAAPGFAQDAVAPAEEAARDIHWAYSSFLGTGFYLSLIHI